MATTKTTTGIDGLDKVLAGGYPTSLPTLIKGGPGSGKTILTLFFLHQQLLKNGAAILVTCDESPEQLLLHMDSFGLSGAKFYQDGKLIILDFRPQIQDEVSGEYELKALLFRIEQARKTNKAQAIVIDSLQDMLLALSDCNREMELLKLFTWARDEKVTLLTTIAESTSLLKTQLLEEYAVDCVIHLQQKMNNNLMTRYLRVIKLRGSSYGTNEYPFTIKDNGIFLLPITNTRLNTTTSVKYISTGINDLDAMFDGKGYREGSTTMLTGKSGTAKTIFAASMVNAAIKSGRKVLYVSFEESPSDLTHHLQSVNIDLNQYVKKQQLKIDSRRTIEMGLEEHIISIINMIEQHDADLIVLDPISAFLDMGTPMEVKLLIIRFISYMKMKGLTQIFTELVPDSSGEYSSLSISSMSDNWIRLRRIEQNGELNRIINIIKSRGCKTSNQVKEFNVTSDGIVIEEPYIGDGEMLFGSLKNARIAQDEEFKLMRQNKIKDLEDKIQAMENEFLAKRKIREVQFNSKKQDLMLEKNQLTNEEKKLSRRREDNKRLRE